MQFNKSYKSVTKNNQLLILSFVGMILVVIGALFKIRHCEYEGITRNALLSIGLLSATVAIVLLIIKMCKDNIYEFLNK